MEEILAKVREQFGEVSERDASHYTINLESLIFIYQNYRDHLVDNRHRSLQERTDMYLSACDEKIFDHFMSCYSRCVKDTEHRITLKKNHTISFTEFTHNIMRTLETIDPDFNFQYVSFMQSLRSEMAEVNESLQEKIELLGMKEFLQMEVDSKRESLHNSNPEFLDFFDGIMKHDEKLVSNINDHDFLDLLLDFKKRNYFRRMIIIRLALEKNESKNLVFLLMDRGYHVGFWFINPKGEAYQTCDSLYKEVERTRIPFTNGVIYNYQDHYAKIDCRFRPIITDDDLPEWIVRYKVITAILTELELDNNGIYTIIRRTRLDPSNFGVLAARTAWNAREFWDLTREDFNRARRRFSIRN